MTKIKYWDKPFIKLMIKVIIPFAIIAIIDSLMSIVDQSMIGILQKENSGELAASSLGLRYASICMLFVNSFIAIFDWMIMQYKGKNEIKKIQSIYKVLHLGIFLLGTLAILIALFLANQVMHVFQGRNYGNTSTFTGQAQAYMKIQVFKIIPMCVSSVTMTWLVAHKKQKIIIPFSIVMLVLNVLGNYLFYEVFHFGLNGIALSTILVELFLVISLYVYIYKVNIWKNFFYNPFKIWQINSIILTQGSKKLLMGFQTLLWGSIQYGILIIYTRWYGDVASKQLAIAQPIISAFYLSFNAIAKSKGYFVGKAIGQNANDQALINDKKINMYTFITSLGESVLLACLAFVLPLIWVNASSESKFGASMMLMGVAITYPIAALSKIMLGSLKVAGMGKTIVLSNGLFAFLFEFSIPFILYMINLHVTPLGLNFWQLFWISRLFKLAKLPPTYFVWRKKKWLQVTVK